MELKDRPVHQKLIDIGGATLEVFDAEAPRSAGVVCAAHPAEAYTAETANLLRRVTGTRVVSVNSRGLGNSSGEPGSLESMSLDLDQLRHELDVDGWTFWGISGGGWLAQLYARDFPTSTQGMILESACACYRQRVADPDCIMSPNHASWRAVLSEQGCLGKTCLVSMGKPDRYPSRARGA